MSKAHLSSVLKIIVSGHPSPGLLGHPAGCRVEFWVISETPESARAVRLRLYTVGPQASQKMGQRKPVFGVGKENLPEV